MRNLLIVILAIAMATTAVAQNLELGVSAGMSTYAGDLAPDKPTEYLQLLHPAAGAFLRLNVAPPVSFRLGFNVAKVSADDALNEVHAGRQLSFESNITEVYLTGEWNIFNWYPGSGNLRISPYAFAGVNVFHFNPRTLHEDQWIDLQPLGTEGQGLEGYDEKYRLTQYGVPIGFGLKFTINERWTIGGEIGARKLFTDYLDDVSSTVVVYDDVYNGNGPLAARLSNPFYRSGQFGCHAFLSAGPSGQGLVLHRWHYPFLSF